MLEIDGSLGEGGGQVLRTSLSLSAVTGRPFRLYNIRARRSKPGLRPQHLTAVRAVAAICRAELKGDELNATTLEFRPQSRPRGGTYRFDVTEAAQGGSAGSVTLIFQAILWPLLFAGEPAQVTLHGGTHVPFSPPYHYLAQVAHPVFARMGATYTTQLDAWGWYPAGGGTMMAVIDPLSQLQAISLAEGERKQVQGVAAVTNLPSHIPNRMARRASNLLNEAGFSTNVRALRERGKGPGAGIVLWLPHGGFTALGRKGLPAEKVAETAVGELLSFTESEGVVDQYLADQLLIPLALAAGTTTFTTVALTSHTQTNAQLLRQWLDVSITITDTSGQPGIIAVTGTGYKNSLNP